MFGYITKLAEPNFVRLKKPIANTPSAEELGVAWAAKYTDKTGAATIRELRQLSPEELLAKTAYYPTRATIDGWLLSNHPTRVFAQGQQADVPTMIGTTSDEGNFFLAWIKPAGRTEFVGKLQDFYGDAAEELVKAFPSSNAKELRQAGSRFVTDSWFVQPSRQMLQGMANVRSPVFQYEFARPSRTFPALGAPHAIELRYVFNTLKDRENRPRDQVLADIVTDYWVQFAKTGNPNSGNLPRWPEYRNDTREYIQFGHEIRIASNLHGVTCDALDQASRGVWARD
jgi:para-nitrobenzyl esterase